MWFLASLGEMISLRWSYSEVDLPSLLCILRFAQRKHVRLLIIIVNLPVNTLGVPFVFYTVG